MSILTFTEAAILHIQSMLKNKSDSAVFRLSVKKTGCSGYMYVPEIVDQKRETDIEVSTNPLPVYVDAASVSMIQGSCVDYVKKNLGVSQLTFDNPNADSLCGCGESFNLKK